MMPICSVLVVRYYFGVPFFRVPFLPPVNDNGALKEMWCPSLCILFHERERELASAIPLLRPKLNPSSPFYTHKGSILGLSLTRARKAHHARTMSTE